MNAPELARARPPLWSRASAKLKRWSSIVTRRLLLPFASEPTPDRWIFVLGCYNGLARGLCHTGALAFLAPGRFMGNLAHQSATQGEQ